MDTASAIIALAIALVFLTSGIGKLRGLDASAATLSALRLPVVAPPLTVGTLSVAEIVVGLGVLLASPWLLLAGSIAALLALVFLVVVWRAHRLGSTEDCGCFGESDGSRIGPALIVRNGVLLVTALVLVTLAAAGAGGVPEVVAVAARGDIAPLLAVGAAALVGALIVAILRAQTAPTPHLEPAAEPASAAPRRIDSLVFIEKATGEAIDVAKQARGRAQLLVFVKPGCGACEVVLSHLDEHHDALSRVVTATVLAELRQGDRVGAQEGDDSRIDALDAGRLGATAIGVGRLRPSAALIAADGTIVQPLAEGSPQVIELIDAIVAAADA